MKQIIQIESSLRLVPDFLAEHRDVDLLSIRKRTWLNTCRWSQKLLKCIKIECYLFQLSLKTERFFVCSSELFHERNNSQIQ